MDAINQANSVVVELSDESGRMREAVAVFTLSS